MQQLAPGEPHLAEHGVRGGAFEAMVGAVQQEGCGLVVAVAEGGNKVAELDAQEGVQEALKRGDVTVGKEVQSVKEIEQLRGSALIEGE